MQRSRAERSFSLALCLFAVVLALHVFLQSSFFRLEHLVIEGTDDLSAGDFLALTGVEYGQNLYDMNLPELEERVKELPFVLSVHIQRRLPGSLKVSVTERLPVAAVVAGGHFWLVDKEGHVIGPKAPTESFLVVTGPDIPSRLEPGEVIDSPALRTAFTLAGELPAHLQLELAEIQCAAGGGLYLLTRDGVMVRFGSLAQSEEKCAVLYQLLRHITANKEKPHLIDISNPAMPAVR
ncbi:MAG TPA: FtsQ-type POTRA domain-containing protein [Firmicutes bacterium]|nr:FtsQ-type POTRA domain-containing protein [Bacillota bacterium]